MTARPSLFVSTSLALASLTALAGCPSKQEQCAAAIPVNDPALSAELRAEHLAQCEADDHLRRWLQCSRSPADYDALLRCATLAGVQFPISIDGPKVRPSPNAATAATKCEGLASTAPKDPPSPQTPYRPTIHGLRFPNHCELSPGAFGCCEGMSYGSLDYFRRGLEVPLIARPATSLADWRALDDWIKARQREEGWANWPLYTRLTWDTNPYQKYADSKAGWEQIKRSLDGGNPILVGLIPQPTQIWHAHAVVAWAYAEDASDPKAIHKYVWIYDPNLPGDDDVWLEMVDSGPPGSIFWLEYDADPSCPTRAWWGITNLDYRDPGRLAGSKVPNLFTAAQLQTTDGAFLQRILQGGSPVGQSQIVRSHAAFSISTINELKALGGDASKLVNVYSYEFSPFTCEGNKAMCAPSQEIAVHEIFSGRQGKVRPDKTFCSTLEFGALVPDKSLDRFTLRPECAGIVPPPPVQPGVSGLHTVIIRLANIDDDAYVWMDKVGRLEDKVCMTELSAGDTTCDVTRKLHVSDTILVFKIGNRGLYGSRGDMFVEIDGKVAWEGHERDAGWKHGGWTYRARVSVDLVNGTAKQVGEVDTCYNVRDCED